MKPSGIGGMAVMEGVMMKNKDVYAVAVRKPDNEIAVETNTHKDFSDKVKLFKLPIFRGILAFVDSMVVGVKVLNYSASFFDEDGEETQTDKKKKKKDNKAKDVDEDFIVEDVTISHNETDGPKNKLKIEKDEKKNDKSNAILMALAVVISIAMSISLFMVLPVLLTGLLTKLITNRYLIAFIEGIVRLAIFIGYVILASRMKEIKRVFMYHGAEHKTINCLESGFELTVENVRWQSKQHKRCGTSFMLLVMLISLVFFMLLPSSDLLWRVLSRIILVPLIAGISYEFIRLAGKSESKVVNVISQPGLWMQGLTTKEPDDSMIEVAILSVGAVFDWKTFLETSAAEKPEAKGKTAKRPETKQASTKQTSTKQASTKQTSTKQASTTQTSIKQASTKQVPTKQTATTNGNNKNVSVTSQQATSNKTENQTSDNKAHTSVKPQVGGLTYTGKVESAEKKANSDKNTQRQAQSDITVNADKSAIKHNEVSKNESDKLHDTHQNPIGRNKGTVPVTFKPNISVKADDEDDDILKALDKFFDDNHKGNE